MNLFDVYPLFNIAPVKGEDCHVWDDAGNCYLDFYGGHAVISIGHSHPHYVERIGEQLQKLGFYSNSIQNPLQGELAEKPGRLSGYEGYSLFLCNSGAETGLFSHRAQKGNFLQRRLSWPHFGSGGHYR